jgi:hypothetical protein
MASAAGLETPEVVVPSEIKAETATFQGIATPHSTPEVGSTYDFLYRVSPTECKGESSTSEQMDVLPAGELVTEPVTALKAGTTYSVCLAVHNKAKTEEAISAPVVFTTIPAPTTETPEAIGTTTATFKGKLTPLNATVPTEYLFFFNFGETSACTNEFGTPLLENAGTGAVAKAVSVPVIGLEPNQKYTVCLLSLNAFGFVEDAVPAHFTTKPAPPAIDSESASVNSTSATLKAQVNPDNEKTKYTFEYSTTESGGALTGTPVKLPGESELEGNKVQTAEVSTGAVLEAGKTYYYRVVAANGTPPATEGAVQSFTTVPTPQTETPGSIGATTATFKGTLTPLNPNTATQYHFDYKLGTECTGESETPTGEAGKGTAGASESTPVSGLSPDTLYTVCLIASNAFGSEQASPVTFRTLPEADVTDVASTSVTFHAVLDPEGSSTSYHFEYGPNTSYGSQTPEETAEGPGPVPVEVHLQGLSASTTYHYRVVATDAAHETFQSEDQAFTTQPTGLPFVLPDNRAYEMVTPVQKQGAEFKAPGGETEIRAAASGDVIADGAELPTEAGPEGNGNVNVSVLSTRTSSGWSSRVIAPPHPATGPAREAGGEYVAFSEDLSAAVVDPAAIAFEPLSPQASEQTPYLRTDYFNGNPAEACQAPYTSAESCYAPLVSSSDDTASPFVPFGGMPQGFCHSQPFHCGPEVRAATADLSHLVLASQVPLTATAAPTGGHNELPDLYEYSAGELQLVSILPGQQQGSPDLYVAGREGLGPEFRNGEVAARHAISADGDRVILEESTSPASAIIRTALYLRDLAKNGGKGETIRLDLPEPGCNEPTCTGSVEPEYVDANAEDTKIFFLDSARLTGDSGASFNIYITREDKPDLYECEIVERGEKDKCNLTDLTPKTEAGESASVATMLGASEDGSYVYFAAAGGLGIATTGGCENISGGETGVSPSALCNLFVRHNGVTKLVTGLSQQDASDWTNDSGTPPSAVRVAPNGSYLAFLSQRPLTGYDTRSAATGQPVSEAYLYHAPENLGTEAGTLSCASCDPTGARPIGPASVPAWPAFNNITHPDAFYQPRYLSDEGRLFFNSPDALVEKDVSKQSEVFEYEPAGVPAGEHACSASSSSGSEVFKPANGAEGAGCVALISTGTAAEGSQFLEASAGGGEGEAGEAGSAAGRDVFFLTSEKVLPQDLDTAPDVYDAHECTTASPCIAPPSALRPCETEASCKAPPAPQPTIYAAPATATFNGPGNVTPEVAIAPKKVTKKAVKCKKGDTKNKKGKCVKKAKSKKKTKAKKSAHTNRRAPR